MISKRAEEIQPFLAMEVLERATALEREGAHIIHLEVGEPDFPTPACIQEAAARALREGRTKYTHSLGLPVLREAIAEHYRDRYGVTVSPEQILVTAGTSPAMWLLFSALLQAGDEVILTNPHYACYPNIVRFAGGEPVLVPTPEADGFQFRPEAVAARITPRTRAILLNSPANPTGALLPAERMRALARLGPLVVSDEIYHGLTYEGREHSILEFTDRAVVLNGFSKAYAMTGWRLGYGIIPEWLLPSFSRLVINSVSCTNAFAQAGAIAALTGPQDPANAMREEFIARRTLMVDGLNAIPGVHALFPDATYYAFPNITALGVSLTTIIAFTASARVMVSPCWRPSSPRVPRS